MATAVVTYGAALVHSRWQPRQGGRAIRNRILASAKYEKWLKNCPGIAADGSDTPPRPDAYCVKDGAMLDIETAVLINRDYVEYEECGPLPDQPCVTKVALGTLEQVPESIARCVGQIADKLRHGGLSRNGAIKRIDDGEFLIAYEPGMEIGSKPLQTRTCAMAEDARPQEIVFEIDGPQLDGSDVNEPKSEPIRLVNLRRLVTRATLGS
jgi:hypothetical protein